MTKNVFIERLHTLCDIIPPLLRSIDERALSVKPAPEHWSKKEIIGHLIDSATNNHHRFIRGQFEDVPHIVYDQNAWNRYGYYDAMEGRQLILFWECYNRQLLALIQRLSPELLSRKVDTGDGAPFTLAYLIQDYVAHMEHHLRQIIAY